MLNYTQNRIKVSIYRGLKPSRLCREGIWVERIVVIISGAQAIFMYGKDGWDQSFYSEIGKMWKKIFTTHLRLKKNNNDEESFRSKTF